MASKIIARGKLGDFDVEAVAVNPGAWWGNTWLIEIGLGYSSAYYVVEAGSASDAIDEFADSEHSHHIDIAPENMGDYDEDTVYRAGNDCHPVDLDNVMIHGQEGRNRTNPPAWQCRYFGDGLPDDGIDPTKLGEWPVTGNFDTFTVVERSSFFAVRHNPSGQERPMSDGVGALFNEDGEPLSPGSPGFVEAWTEALNDNESETLEAYFPEFHAID